LFFPISFPLPVYKFNNHREASSTGREGKRRKNHQKQARDFLASYEKVREIQRETGKESKRSLEAVNNWFLLLRNIKIKQKPINDE